MIWLPVLAAFSVVAALAVWVQLVHRFVAPRILTEVGCPRSSIPFGQTATITVTLRNPTRLSCPFVRCRLTLPDGLSLVADNGRVVSFSLPVGAREKITVSFEVAGVRRGRHPMHGMTLDIMDGLTMHRETRYISFFVNVTVHPRRIPARRVVPPPSLTGSSPSRLRLSPTSVDWIDLRPYEPQDSIRDVAWAVSARRGELVVLERAHARNQLVVLVASVRTSSYMWEQNARFADRVYETAFAMIKEWSARGVPVWLYGDGFGGGSAHPSGSRLLIRGAGSWAASFCQRTGHVLGSLSTNAAVPVTRILGEIERTVIHPARIVLLSGYEDDAMKRKIRALRGKGHEVDVMRLDVNDIGTLRANGGGSL